MKTNGYNQWKETGRLLRTHRSPSSKKGIQDMTLDELRQASERFKVWIKGKGKTHPEKAVKTHIHDNYIIPRIAELEKQKLADDKREAELQEDLKLQEAFDNSGIMDRPVTTTYQNGYAFRS